jgi:citrate lyase subunit beta/citryl-CoA lyase
MTLSKSQLETARSLLFVPAHRPDRFAKAASAGADAVIIDLEDAVSPQDKVQARDNAAAWLGQGHNAVIRINPPGTLWFDADLDMATRHRAPIMVPKSENPAVLAALARRTAGTCLLMLLIETAAGVERALGVCATPGAVRVAFGNADFSGQLGIAHDDHLALAYARSRLVSASAAVGLCPPIDGVTTCVADMNALTADIVHARRLGFTGKLCIHPAQTAAVTAHFTPTEYEQKWARAVVAADGSVTVVDGEMVDKPLVERARRILSAADHLGGTAPIG